MSKVMRSAQSWSPVVPWTASRERRLRESTVDTNGRSCHPYVRGRPRRSHHSFMYSRLSLRLKRSATSVGRCIEVRCKYSSSSDALAMGFPSASP